MTPQRLNKENTLNLFPFGWLLPVAALVGVALATLRRGRDSKETILKRIIAPRIPGNHINLLDFEDVTQAGSDWKPAFDLAMEQAKKLNGGRIMVPAGTYRINGPIHFQSNTELHLQKDAVLLFSAVPASYLPVVKTSWEGTFLYNYSPFIYGLNLQNIALTGLGTIKAENAHLWEHWRKLQKKDQHLSRQMNHRRVPLAQRVFGDGHFLRPHLIQFFGCENVLVEDIRVEDSPFWCIHPILCRNVILRGLRFNSHYLNNDGIDPEYAEDVLIENISFNNANDNIAIKAGRDHDGRASRRRGSQNIIIRRCWFMGLHGVVIGSEMSGGVRNVYIEDCTYAGKLKRGIYLKTNADRGGEIAHIHARNIALGEVEEAIVIASKYKNEGQGFQTNIHNISFSNITCQKSTGHGILVEGYPDKKVRKLSFTNVTIEEVHLPLIITNTSQLTMRQVCLGQAQEAVPRNY